MVTKRVATSHPISDVQPFTIGGRDHLRHIQALGHPSQKQASTNCKASPSFLRMHSESEVGNMHDSAQLVQETTWAVN